ncbi:MAG: polyamine aminopropyltransferase [Ruminiclostridium sp.]|nr:polyamine aminopropyltransferase [Ruminiclostridium sp.]
MELWFTENHSDSVRFSIRVDEHLYTTETDYQRIDVFNSLEFGKLLALDGYVMITEKDEFIYHDMIVHVPMAVKKDVKNVLVIGAGDGGTIRELCRYDTVEHIDLVEIDEKVVEVCKKYFPSMTVSMDDKRVDIHYTDGLRFVRRKINEYDLIIVDSTDPFGPGEGLFTKEFYGNCYNALTENGVLVNQHESPFYINDAKAMCAAHKRLSSVFPLHKVYQAHIPTYASGHWLFGFASKGLHPVEDLDEEYWNSLGIKTKYYNTKLHKGSFALPSYVLDMLEKGFEEEY